MILASKIGICDGYQGAASWVHASSMSLAAARLSWKAFRYTDPDSSVPPEVGPHAGDS